MRLQLPVTQVIDVLTCPSRHSICRTINPQGLIRHFAILLLTAAGPASVVDHVGCEVLLGATHVRVLTGLVLIEARHRVGNISQGLISVDLGFDLFLLNGLLGAISHRSLVSGARHQVVALYLGRLIPPLWMFLLLFETITSSPLVELGLIVEQVWRGPLH